MFDEKTEDDLRRLGLIFKKIEALQEEIRLKDAEDKSGKFYNLGAQLSELNQELDELFSEDLGIDLGNLQLLDSPKLKMLPEYSISGDIKPRFKCSQMIFIGDIKYTNQLQSGIHFNLVKIEEVVVNLLSDRSFKIVYHAYSYIHKNNTTYEDEYFRKENVFYSLADVDFYGKSKGKLEEIAKQFLKIKSDEAKGLLDKKFNGEEADDAPF